MPATSPAVPGVAATVPGVAATVNTAVRGMPAAACDIPL